MNKPRTIGFLANTSWYLYNFRLAEMKTVQRCGVKVLAIAPPDEYSEKIRAEGIGFFPLPLKRRDFSPWGKLRAVRRLRRIQKTESIDLMRHFTLEAIFVGTMAAGRNGPKLVQSVTGMGFVYAGNEPAKRILRAIFKPVLQWCLAKGPVIVENRGDLVAVTKIIGKNLRYPVEQIPGGGIDVSRYCREGRVTLKRDSGAIRFLAAGRLLRGKGVGLFAQAAEKYNGAPAEFFLAGMPDKGNPEAYSRQEIEEWNRIPGFKWLGNVEDIPSLLRSVDVLVHPTFYGEGLPRIIMEAEACGLPVITTNIPACAEAVTDGTNGWVLDRKDPEKLAELMASSAADPVRRSEMGDRNRVFAVAEFDENKVIRRTMDVYRRHFPNWNPLTD